jgi:hypothetical protein
MRRDHLVTALVLLVLGMTFQVRAEIRVVTDEQGKYETTRVLRTGRSGDVWSPLPRTEVVKNSLNVNGFRVGDLFPTIRESSVAPHHPWIVWSRLNGGRYDLAWSRWSVTGWSPIGWVVPSNQEPGDNLDADLAFDSHGRAFVVWWRNEAGTGRVFLSVFLDPYWMTPLDVSEPGVDGRHPTLEFNGDSTLVVRFVTPEGVVEQLILFNVPVTITDDINPLDFVHPGTTTIVDN